MIDRKRQNADLPLHADSPKTGNSPRLGLQNADSFGYPSAYCGDGDGEGTMLHGSKRGADSSQSIGDRLIGDKRWAERYEH